MLNIKIYSSHRIDKKSKALKSGILVPIRCGAFFDHSNSPIMGDDTGDNISNRRLPYCEATVEYWVWKNSLCDFVGLCHYRRFFAFNSFVEGKRNCFNQIEIFRLSPKAVKKYSLDDDAKIRKVCATHDAIIPEGASVEEISREFQLRVRTVEQLWLCHEGRYFDYGCLQLFKQIIKDGFPELYESAERYLFGSIHRGFNCFVFRSNIYNDFCSKQFKVLSELEAKIATKNRFSRDLGYFSEIFFGIYTQYLLDKGIRCKSLPLVFVQDPNERIFSIITLKSLLVFLAKKILPQRVYSFFRYIWRAIR